MGAGPVGYGLREYTRTGFYGQAIAVPESGVLDGIDTALAPGTSVTGKVTDWDQRVSVRG